MTLQNHDEILPGQQFKLATRIFSSPGFRKKNPQQQKDDKTYVHKTQFCAAKGMPTSHNRYRLIGSRFLKPSLVSPEPDETRIKDALERLAHICLWICCRNAKFFLLSWQKRQSLTRKASENPHFALTNLRASPRGTKIAPVS
jgi:hypothetical protein